MFLVVGKCDESVRRSIAAVLGFFEGRLALAIAESVGRVVGLAVFPSATLLVATVVFDTLLSSDFRAGGVVRDAVPAAFPTALCHVVLLSVSGLCVLEMS